MLGMSGQKVKNDIELSENGERATTDEYITFSMIFHIPLSYPLRHRI